jgi:molybdopterin-guanine dinucleotide biosynthesis protein A
MAEPQIHDIAPRTEICILAAGLSSRMGEDKAKLVLGGKTLLAHIRATARQLDPAVRIIRRDLVPRCGPLGGVYTALKTTEAEAVLFLSCDMPFVTVSLLERLISGIKDISSGIFVVQNERPGFPFILKVNVLASVEEMIGQKRFSLQNLARTLQAEMIDAANSAELFNINTPRDWIKARQLWLEFSRLKA